MFVDRSTFWIKTTIKNERSKIEAEKNQKKMLLLKLLDASNKQRT
jgi:hypothetical protein